jgi:hypothetical protein
MFEPLFCFFTGKLPGDYLIASDQFANEFAFFKFGGFDPSEYFVFDFRVESSSHCRCQRLTISMTCSCGIGISALAFAQGQTVTIGELLTILTVLTTPAEGFKGKVLSIVGENDLYVVPLSPFLNLSPDPFSSIYIIEHCTTSTLPSSHLST